ncbi:hypothetical protein Ahy_B10g104634 isoform B [Arachis hypogaea]|uniref:Uncharacterized protein n=1 Tax=Arachis hypogaea TaxID=3818 RepID=A0A444X631_ARAHY|nr:hypothetical protein Ahy_B10g104634 isoform B [Arachis hypogaea]
MKWVEKLFYKILIFVLRDDVKYNLLVIGSDKDSQVLFHYHRQFSEVRTLELLAKLVDVVCSLGGLNRNPQPLAMASCSSSILVGVSASVPVIAPEVVLVASPSFAADLNRNCDGKIGDTRPFGELSIAMASTPDVVPIFEQDGALDGVKDVLLEDYDDDDVESATIADDRDDDIARSNPVDKEEVILSVKTYSIQRGVEYKVLESDYPKYYGKCKEFDNGCTWLIRISLCQRRGIWEVK